MFENLLFVSYRRTDTAPHALALKLELERQFRAAQVFVDTDHIQGGESWPSEIEFALSAAKVVLPIVGQNWVGPAAEGGRRIDDPNDWVRKEIELALRLKPDAVIPLFVDGVEAVPAHLPESCKELGFRHGIASITTPGTCRWIPWSARFPTASVTSARRRPHFASPLAAGALPLSHRSLGLNSRHR